ncbi:MAG: phage major capsid protein, partial [Cellvibrionaceae bacterium]|nr:phage major capsid protein [Cellvibrionaceae bacterium]
EMAAKAATPVGKNGAPAVHIKPDATQYQGSGFVRTALAMAAAGGDTVRAAAFAHDKIGDASVAMAIETGAASGGALIPQNTAQEVIELLRHKTVIRRLGARSVPLPNGNLSLPRMSGGATASYVGEGKDVTATESTFDDVQLSAKTMITIVPISNQLVGRTGPQVERIVMDDMLAAMSVREDKAFLRDDGANGTPTGFKKIAETASRTVQWSGSSNLQKIDEYLDAMILKLMNSDSLLIKPGWALSPRSYMKLFGLRDGNGNKVYPEMARGLLKGYPVEHTNSIPANLGDSTKEAEIYFADFNDIVIGEDGGYTIDFSRDAAYKDKDGKMVSAYSRNQSVLRLTAEHDIGFRHPEGLCLGTGVVW